MAHATHIFGPTLSGEPNERRIELKLAFFIECVYNISMEHPTHHDPTQPTNIAAESGPVDPASVADRVESCKTPNPLHQGAAEMLKEPGTTVLDNGEGTLFIRTDEVKMPLATPQDERGSRLTRAMRRLRRS